MDFSWRCEWFSDWSDDKAKCPALSITNISWCLRDVAMGYIIVSDDSDPDAMWKHHCHPGNI